MSYQNKEPDQIEFSEKVNAYTFIVFIILAIIWKLLF